MAASKDHWLNIRLSSADRRRISTAAASHGMTDSEYVRHALDDVYSAEPLHVRKTAEFAVMMDAEKASSAALADA